MPKLVIGAIVFASLLAALTTAVFWSERIRFAGDGSDIVRHTRLPDSSGFPLTVERAATIVIEGDSLVAGRRRDGRGDPWPALLENRLDGPRVINRARGGFTAGQGEAFWSKAACSDVAVLLYGANDAAIRGWWHRRKKVPIADYKADLGRSIRRHIACKAVVVVLAPLAPGSDAMEQRLQPYRAAARSAAMENGALFVDPLPAWDGIEAPLTRDGLHLSECGHAALADYLSNMLQVR